jgi:Fe-S cluster assembly iron-binding protein IscA
MVTVGSVPTAAAAAAVTADLHPRMWGIRLSVATGRCSGAAVALLRACFMAQLELIFQEQVDQ